VSSSGTYGVAQRQTVDMIVLLNRSSEHGLVCSTLIIADKQPSVGRIKAKRCAITSKLSFSIRRPLKLQAYGMKMQIFALLLPLYAALLVDASPVRSTLVTRQDCHAICLQKYNSCVDRCPDTDGMPDLRCHKVCIDEERNCQFVSLLDVAKLPRRSLYVVDFLSDMRAR
jgi:hypothetical protein